MARKYMLDPNETVRVVIFVDTRNGFVVHQTKDVYEKLTGAKPYEMFEEGQDLPDGVFLEWAEFAKPSFSLQQEMEQDTIDYAEDGSFRVNLRRQSELKLKHLLRKWSLDEEEPELKIITVKDAKSRPHLTPACLQMVMNQVQPALITGFLTAHNFAEQRRIKRVEDETKAEVQSATGVPAPN